MKISNINSVNYNILNRNITLRKTPLRFDRVMFCGFNPSIYSNPNIKEAIELGVEIYNNPNKSPEEIISKYAPDLKILSNKDIPDWVNAMQDCDACYMYGYNRNLNPDFEKMYIMQKPKRNTKIDRLLYAANIAHEYTHHKQINSKEEIEFIKNLSNGNFEYAAVLGPIGDKVFNIFDENYKIYFTRKIFSLVDIINEKIHGCAVPRIKHFKKKDILESQNMNTFEEFKNFMLNSFDISFDNTLEKILSPNSEADKKIVRTVKSILEQKNGYKKLKQDIKLYCLKTAQKEKEAYSTECLVARKILNTNKQLNTDSYALYYEMLECAFK